MEALFDFPLYILFLLMFAAFSASFVDSIAGGGGLIQVPAFLLAGLPAQFALGTNKLVSICGTGAAALNFIKNGKVIWKIALMGLLCSLIGSVIGTKTILFFDEKTVTKIIMFILPFTAIITFIPKKNIRSELSEFSKKDIFFLTPLIGFVVGFYDGFFGPGAGLFLIIAFHAIIGLSVVNASAIAKIINFGSNLGAVVTFAMAGKILFGIALPLIAASILGGYVGSKLAIKKGQRFIKIMIIVVFIIMFISLILKFI